MKNILFLLMIIICLCGCNQEKETDILDAQVIKTKNGKYIELCIEGYVFIEKRYDHGVGITQFFEYVNGQTKPKMCENRNDIIRSQN